MSTPQARPTSPCRGWGLVSRGPDLTEAERAAGAAHAEICRHCRDRLAAVERVRAQVLGGSAGVVGAAAGAQLLPWGGAAGTLVTGKAAAGVIGAVGAAVLATGGAAVAVDRAHPHHPHPAPAVTAPAAPAAPRGRSPRTAPSRPASPPPGPSHVPVPLPSTLPTAVPQAPAPTLPAPQLPVVPLPQLPAVPQLPGPLLTPLQRLLDLGD